MSWLLMCLSLPIFPTSLQAYGNNLAATALITGALVWHILHPPADGTSATLPAADGKLHPAFNSNPH
jgi:hypothetical protein